MGGGDFVEVLQIATKKIRCLPKKTLPTHLVLVKFEISEVAENAKTVFLHITVPVSIDSQYSQHQ